MWVVAGPERDGVAATPYILTGLAVALGFRGGVFNIGGGATLHGSTRCGGGWLYGWRAVHLGHAAMLPGGPFLVSSKPDSAPTRSSIRS